MKAILLFTTLLLLASCGTRKPLPPIESNRDSIYIEKLVPYPLPPDSATIRALMECDEHGRVVLRWLDMATTRNAELAFSLDSLGNLKADVIVRRDTLYLPSQEIYVTREVKVPYPVPAKLTKWEQFKMDVGGWAIGVLSGVLLLGIIYVVLWLIKKRK